MRIEFAKSTGCPYGQFVVYAENEQDCAMLEIFLQGAGDRNYRFWRHGETYYNGHIRGFNFGWVKKHSDNLLTKIKRRLKRK